MAERQLTSVSPGEIVRGREGEGREGEKEARSTVSSSREGEGGRRMACQVLVESWLVWM